MSAPRPEEGQRLHNELAVNLLRKICAKQTYEIPQTPNSELFLSKNFRLMVINKTAKLPQTPANPTNAVFSERLPRFLNLLNLQNIHQR